MLVGGVVAGSDRVEVLAVQLDALEAPVADGLLHQRDVIVDGRLVGVALGQRVPPADLLEGTVLVQQQHVAVLVEDLAAGIGGQRRQPQARAQALGAHGLHEVAHVGIAARKLLPVDLPVAFVGLPAVVEHGPLEADLAHLRQRGQDLRDGEVALVAPRAPGGLEGGRRRLRRGDAFGLHEVAVEGERGEVIAGVRAQERAFGGQRLAGRKRDGLRALHGDARALGGPAHGQVKRARHGFDMADGQADVAPPDIGDRRAAAVVRRVHAQRVALVEVVAERLHPVAAVFVRGAGEAPEAARRIRQFMRRRPPAGHVDRLRAGVAVAHLHQGQARGLFEEGHRDLFLDALLRHAGEDVAQAGAMARVAHRLALLAIERKGIDGAAVLQQQHFTGLERRQRLALVGDTRAQCAVERQRQQGILGRHGGAAGGQGTARRPGQGGQGGAADGKLQDGAATNGWHGRHSG